MISSNNTDASATNSGIFDGTVRCVPQPKQNQQNSLPVPCRYSKQPTERTGNSHRHPFGEAFCLWWRSHARTHAGNQLCRQGTSTVNPANFLCPRKASQEPGWLSIALQRSDCWSSGPGYQWHLTTKLSREPAWRVGCAG